MPDCLEPGCFFDPSEGFTAVPAGEMRHNSVGPISRAWVRDTLCPLLRAHHGLLGINEVCRIVGLTRAMVLSHCSYAPTSLRMLKNDRGNCESIQLSPHLLSDRYIPRRDYRLAAGDVLAAQRRARPPVVVLRPINHRRRKVTA